MCPYCSKHRVLEGKYSYVVTTHIDKGHVHNHIIFCAADNIKHDKYHDCKQSYYRIRKLSDELCSEHNLYNTAYKKSQNPDAYFRMHERQIILYGGARRMPEQAGIPLKGLNIDKMKTEYQALTAQKNELTTTYKNCEKEVKSLNVKPENLNQYLGRTETQKNEQEQPDRNNTPAR